VGADGTREPAVGVIRKLRETGWPGALLVLLVVAVAVADCAS